MSYTAAPFAWNWLTDVPSLPGDPTVTLRTPPSGVGSEVPAGAEEGRGRGRREGRKGKGWRKEQGCSRVKDAVALPVPQAFYSATIS